MKQITLNLFLFVAVIVLSATNGENVPAFLWGSKTSSYTPALRTYDAKSFSSIVKDEQTENTVTVVFYENNLSVEDITQCKRVDGSTCFTYLKSVSPKTYLPSVENPVTNLKIMAEQKKSADAHLNADGIISEVSNIVSGSYIFVSLTDDKSGENNVEKLTRHDAAIKKFVENLEDKYEVLAIYTGNHAPVSKHSLRKREAAEPTVTKVPTVTVAPSASPDNSSVKPNQPRADETPGSFKNIDDKVLVHWTKLEHTDSANVYVELTISDIVILNGTEFHYELKATTTGSDLVFNLVSKLGGWDLENVRYADKEYRHEKISVNNGFSYHCGPGVIFSSKEAEHRIIWRGLQIQPRWNTTGTFAAFSDSWDCVGFVSPAIWSGLFVTLILIAILSCGLSWVFDIKTMDRFDDPKGKTITVTETD